jgi:AcrR family transcriptional regulator
MPRKQQFTTEDVVTAAFELVRDKGLAGLSAPAVAEKMSASTMPIYSHFKNMQALEDEVVKKAWKMVDQYQSNEYTGDIWIDQAIGYIRFAREENNLFKCILDGRNRELKLKMNRRQWENLTKALDDYDAFKDLDDEKVLRVRYARVMISHGIATAAKIGLNKIFFENEGLLARFLTGASQALLHGYKDVPALDGEERRLMEKKIKELLDSEK